jgi:serine/threonine protein kinase
VLRSHYVRDEEFAERFRREARSAADLSHPNIVQVYDRGETEDGTCYIAMDYVPGGTLKEWLGEKGPAKAPQGGVRDSPDRRCARGHPRGAGSSTAT